MFLPYEVIDQLSAQEVATWNTHFAGDRHDRLRTIEEGIWRRTQFEGNADLSGWCPGDGGRRRIVHYRYEYGLDYTYPVPRLVLDDLYLYHSFTVPAQEIDAHVKDVHRLLGEGGWKHKSDGWWKGDLRVVLGHYDGQPHPQDERAGRATPDGYASFDVTFASERYLTVPRALRNLPWNVLAGGARVKDERGEPEYADDLADHLPFQVEIGCGTSIEAGISPLHYLHEVYRVTDRTDNALGQTYRFTLHPSDDPLISELLLDAEGKAADLVRMYRECFQAEPTPAHHALRRLRDAGHLVGPIITHNFDALPARVGLDEAFVRRYDQKIPPVPMPEEARSLLVIGLHADRRAVQARARERGLKIFFVDPEGLTEHGEFRSYPIEGARRGDIVVKNAAVPAMTQLLHLLNLQENPAHQA